SPLTPEPRGETSMRLLGWTALALIPAAVPVRAAADPQPVIDNPEVMVLDLHLAKGESTPRSSAEFDTVILYASGGHVRMEGAKGRAPAKHHAFGEAVFIPKGADVREVVTGAEPVHLVVVTLKAAPHRIPNSTGLPPAFPRRGVVKRLDNDKVV